MKKPYFLDEIKIKGVEPTPEYQEIMKRQREGKLTENDLKILENRGYKMKEKRG